MELNIRKALKLLTVLACTACTDPYPNVEQMTGIIDQSFTRTSFVEDGIKLKVNWEYGDYIVVRNSGNHERDRIDESGNETYEESGYDRAYSYITEYIEENKALFACMEETEPAAPYTAYYPREICENTLSNIQKYKADGPYQAPMMAKAPTMYLLFRPICGAIELKLSTALDNAVIKNIVLWAKEPLCGSFYVDDDLVAHVTGENRLTLDCGAGVQLGSEPKSFWFSVPQNTFTGVQVTLNTTDGRSQTYRLDDGESIEVVRGEITSCPVNLRILNKSQEMESVTLPTGLEFNRFIKKVSNPGTDFSLIEPDFPDSNIKAIRFETASAATDGLNISTADEAPVYASFDSTSGVMTISTPAKEMRLHRDGTCMFRYLTALEEVDIEALVTDSLCNMTYMFNHCESLPYVNIKAICPDNIQDMDNCFSDCWVIDNLDFSEFRNNKLENIRSCFLRCYELSGKMDLSGITSGRVKYFSYTFNECKKLTSIDIRNIIPIATASNMASLFYKVPCLEEIYVNDRFYPTDKISPTNIFAGSAEAQATRTAYKSGKLTIHCSQESADWFAITTLRWINRGYPNKKVTPVTFIDNASGKTLSVTWASN